MFKKKNNNQTKDQLVIDTSGLMDGRIEQIISLGFLNYQILVPKFVVLELQAVADKSDKIRRDRAREALNLTNELIKSDKAELINPDVEKDEVDNMLIATSLSLNAKLYTTDYNLQKVAEIEGVTVLNPNQLIYNIKLNFTPGEVIELKLSGKGTERDQAVGYVKAKMGTLFLLRLKSRHQTKLQLEIITLKNQPASLCKLELEQRRGQFQGHL